MTQKFGEDYNCNSSLEKLSNDIEHIIMESIDVDAGFTEGETFKKNGFVIAINGEWGSGKSTFLRWFEEGIKTPKDKEREASCIYNFLDESKKREVDIIKYNAWKDDYFQEPLISLVGQICEQLSVFKDKKLLEQINELKELGYSLLEEINIGVNFGGIVNVSANSGRMLKKIKKCYNNRHNPKNKGFNQELDIYFKLSKKIKKFKDFLKGFGGKDKIKLIIVDELDRCNPAFAVKFLEVVKHFFNAPNTVFLIAIDKANLAASINKFYGHSFDSNHYLSRFFDFELNLPEDNSEISLGKLIDAHCGHSVNNFKYLLIEIMKLYNFDYRTYKRYLERVRILTKKYENDSQQFYKLSVSLLPLALRIYNENKFDEFTKFRSELKPLRGSMGGIDKDNGREFETEVVTDFKKFFQIFNSNDFSFNEDGFIDSSKKENYRVKKKIIFLYQRIIFFENKVSIFKKALEKYPCNKIFSEQLVNAQLLPSLQNLIEYIRFL